MAIRRRNDANGLKKRRYANGLKIAVYEWLEKKVYEGLAKKKVR